MELSAFSIFLADCPQYAPARMRCSPSTELPQISFVILSVRQYTSDIFSEKTKDLIFDRRDMDFLLPDIDRLHIIIDLQASVLKKRLRFCRITLHILNAAERPADPSPEAPPRSTDRRKWLSSGQSGKNSAQDSRSPSVFPG